VSLAGGVLIKENHIAAAGGISRAIKGAKQVAPHGLKIETEVRSLKELAEALDAGVDGVLLDNFSPIDVKRAVQKISGRIFIEVSGGLDAKNIGDYAIPGVDVLSSGSLTHSVTATDLSLLIND
jgi:nicotinate-nucleotide pyrophosphorylase (carboxylating)